MPNFERVLLKGAARFLAEKKAEEAKKARPTVYTTSSTPASETGGVAYAIWSDPKNVEARKEFGMSYGQWD